MSEDLRIGLIGCGAMGQGHLSVWAETPGARVVAVCDPIEARAKETAYRIGATAYTDLEDMLRHANIDAVDICTPSGLHADQGILAARFGKHVLCEKPLDLNIEKVDRLIEECEKRGLTLACIFQRRTYPGAQQVQKAVAEGRMGRILSCSAYIKWWRSQEYYGTGTWRGTWALDGGVLANQAIHAIDHLCWLAGPVAEVEYACLETANHQIEAEDFAIVVMRYENGARGVIEATTCCYPDLCTRVEIFGTRGSAAFADATVTHFGLDGENLLHTLQNETERLGGGSQAMAISMRGHQVQLADFVEAVQDRRPPLVNGRDARMAVDALNKIYRKAFPHQKIGT
jgi:UDP-N-acetyl-2-amino-2-deoxyglucuronate dehydrogenase